MSGKVYLVGAGPGDPELLTLKALRLLRAADVVLHDELVAPEILALIPPSVHVRNVGKRCGAKRITQAEINTLMIESARRGMNVVRLKGGDPAIFGRLAEELDALGAAEVPFETVPGITTGLAAAASIGVSLTDRRKSSRVVIVSGHRTHGNDREKRNDWTGLAREDTTLVVYMPGRDLSDLSEELLEAGLSPETPAVAVSRATAPQQRQLWTTLADLYAMPPMESPSILLIGHCLDRTGQRIGADSSSLVFDGVGWASLLELVELEVSAATSNRGREGRITL